jgi:hypothetical protein
MIAACERVERPLLPPLKTPFFVAQKLFVRVSAWCLVNDVTI